MGITKLRGNLQVKESTVTSDRIHNRTIIGEDIALGSLDGALFIDGSIPGAKIDIEALAGEGINANTSTWKLDLKIDSTYFQIDADTLKPTDLLTQQGNTFNGPSQLVKLLPSGKLPAIDGSNLTNVWGMAVGFVDMLIPSGDVDGANKTFVLPHVPVAGSLHLFLNGVLQHAGASNDYTITGDTIEFISPPSDGSLVTATYRA